MKVVQQLTCLTIRPVSCRTRPQRFRSSSVYGLVEWTNRHACRLLWRLVIEKCGAYIQSSRALPFVWVDRRPPTCSHSSHSWPPSDSSVIISHSNLGAPSGRLPLTFLVSGPQQGCIQTNKDSVSEQENRPSSNRTVYTDVCGTCCMEQFTWSYSIHH